jgi:hypothetical protein
MATDPGKLSGPIAGTGRSGVAPYPAYSPPLAGFALEHRLAANGGGPARQAGLHG